MYIYIYICIYLFTRVGILHVYPELECGTMMNHP